MAPVPQIDEHGLIGDLRTTALVACDGTVDSLCLPDADSPSVFAAVLDRDRGGHLSVALADVSGEEPVRRRQHYLPNTNILFTRLQAAGAVTEISDFMVPAHLAGSHRGVLVRTVTAQHGPRRVRLECWPGFDYARADHQGKPSDDGHAVIFRASQAGGLRLRCSAELRLEDRPRGPAAVAEVALDAGQTVTLVLDWLGAPDEDATPHDGAPDGGPGDDGAPEDDRGTGWLDLARSWARQTERFWQDWLEGTTYAGRWGEPVRRSALCLKLLQHQPTGGIVAAPTFGLPEWPGAERNWDYRYVWLRDAAFVIFALVRIGFLGEAAGFADWLSRRCADIPRGTGLHPVYRLDGSPPPGEEELDHLTGHAGSRPVRIGNAAYDQVQLDVLGEVLDGLYLFDRIQAISWDLWQALGVQLGWLADHWREPDAGIWEIRGPARQFVSSKLLVWVAFERAGRLARRRGLPGDRDRWQREADAAYRWVQEHGWDAEAGSYVQRAGSADLDASSLLIPMLRFASGHDPRVLATLEAVGGRLSSDSLLYRYRASPPQAGEDQGQDGNQGEVRSLDGLDAPEGTFTMCTFWYAENLARAGQLDRARQAFEKVLTYANDVGLFSEQIGPAGEALGNFPQALTHLALISAATTLDAALGAPRG